MFHSRTSALSRNLHAKDALNQTLPMYNVNAINCVYQLPRNRHSNRNMPSIPVYPPSAPTSPTPSPLPQLLQTPSGLAILEIQGTINVPAPPSTEDGTQDSQQARVPVGKLVFPNHSANNPPEDTAWMKRVYLYVGKHQRLTGEVKKLGKPLGVLRKRQQEAREDANSEELEIVDVVRYKVVFSHRPEPVGVE